MTTSTEKPPVWKRKLELRLPKPAPKGPSKKKEAKPSSKQKRIVGLKIGSSQIAAAVVANNGSPRLLAAAREDLRPGIVTGGELREPEALAASLDAFFQHHDLPRTNVRLGIGSNRIGIRVFERPEVDDPKQLANAIRFRAHEALPIPMEDAMLDYHVLDDGDGPGRVLLAVTYRELVDRFVAACRLAKIELVGIDVEAFALLRAVGGAPLAQGQRRATACVAVTIGNDRTTVAVSDGRVCEFARVLEWGGENLTRTFQRTLEVEAPEAERVKRTVSLATKASGGESTDELAEDAARREVQSLARELGSSLEFYQSQPSSLGLSEIVLTGGTSQVKGIDKELERLLGVGVRIADPFERVGGGRDNIPAGQAGSLAVAIGLGIED
jgi:type IV pilus assembly protein PilM